MEGFYVDAETDGLYLQSSKVWYLKLKSLDGSRELSVWPFRDEKAGDKLREWIHSFEDGCLVVFHNGLGFDMWILWKFFNIQPRVGKGGKDWLDGKVVQYVDTYVLSQYLNPDSPSHSLAYLSSGMEAEKMDFRKKLVEAKLMIGNEPKGFEFSFYSDVMAEYCDTDVDSGIGVFRKLWKKAIEMYGEENWIHPSFRQLQKDYWLYSAQAYSGVKFSKERAVALLAHIDEKMAEIKAEVDPKLPPRPLKTAEQAFYRIPAAPFKKNGEFSANMLKWLEKHNAKVVDGEIHAYGHVVDLKAGDILPIQMPMEIEDNTELKQYFLDSGWVPHDDFWNLKKDPNTGKPERDAKGNVIKTTPKIQHAGQLCPNLLKLDGDIPSKVVKFLSYRNRRGVVQGWLDNWRLEFDGRLSAEISGYTPTFRVRHRTVVNCPKADPKVLLGAEMRDLFTVEEGNWYTNADAAALENRTVAAYTMKYDGGKFADIVLNGDSHTHNSFAFFPEIADKFDPTEVGLKDRPDFKPYRNKAKTGAYLLAYGGGVAKLASSLGLTKAEAQRSYDNYWKMNEGLGKLKEAVEKYYDTKGQKKHIPAWDGRLLSARGKNILINLAGQSCGAIAMSYAGCFMDNWLGDIYLDDKFRPYYLYKGKVVKRVSMVHKHCALQQEC